MNIENEKITEKLVQIAECIEKNKDKMYQNVHGVKGLYSGEFGVLLFMYYYSRFSNDKKFLDATYTYTDILMEKVGIILGNINKFKEGPSFTYCDGLSGILYALKFLNDNDFIQFDFCDQDETMEHLAVVMRSFVKRNNYDFLHGASGLGFYFLKAREYELVEELIGYLYNSSIIKNSGEECNWEMNFNDMKDFDISLSHGISSIIVFLARSIKNNISVDKSTMMLKGAINYILSLEQDFQMYRSHFPQNSIYKKGRLAWCYGDLGVASSIWYAAKIMGNENWKNKALEIFTNSSQRLSLNDSQVMDAGICHGSAGVALIFRRMYLETGNDLFLRTANHWIDCTFDFSKFDDGLAGYKTFHVDSFVCDFSLLTGISGIGLTLLSLVNNDLQEWDELFLLS